MFRRYVYWILFLSSYTPLFVILMIRSWGVWLLVVIFGTVGIVSAALLKLALVSARELNPEPYQIASIKNRSAEVTGYISSYIIPFVLVDFRDWRDLAALAVLFFVVGHVYIHSGLLYVNPMLNLCGFGIYAVEDSSGAERILISTRKPRIGPVSARPFSESVLLEGHS